MLSPSPQLYCCAACLPGSVRFIFNAGMLDIPFVAELLDVYTRECYIRIVQCYACMFNLVTLKKVVRKIMQIKLCPEMKVSYIYVMIFLNCFLGNTQLFV